jgi:hypothetical protein
MLIRPKPSGKRLEPPTLQDEVDALLRRYTRTDIARALRNSTAPRRPGRERRGDLSATDVRRAHRLVEEKRGARSVRWACICRCRDDIHGSGRQSTCRSKRKYLFVGPSGRPRP